MENDIKEIQSFLKTPKDIVIVGHRNPDGDALGSTLALKLFFEKLGQFADVVLPSEHPATFSYLPRVNDTIVYDIDQERVAMKIARAEMIFCLDFNSLSRVDKVGGLIEKSNATLVLIDHHLHPEHFATYEFSDTEASSTCEMVYKFIDDMGLASKITPEIGTCLFTGLVTDTGSFRYGTRPYTYEVAGHLKKLGVDDYQLMNNIFNSMQEKHLRLLGHCLASRMEVMEEYNTAMIHLTKEDYINFKIQRGDTEGIVNYLLMMKNIKLAAFITEQPTIVKLSLRSKDDVDVQEITSKHFNGGGHKNASGGGVYASLKDVISRFKKVVPKYMEKQEV